MTLPTSPNPISSDQVNVELSRAGSTSINMNENIVRDLFAGDTPNPNIAPYLNLSQISFSDGHGKDAPFRTSISINTNDVDVRTYLINQGWDRAKRVVLTIDSGVVISTSGSGTGFYALVVQGSFPRGIRIVNNGVISGKGGPGGKGGGYDSTVGGNLIVGGSAGGKGAAAIYASTPTVIVNNGTIQGGGGGGAGAGAVYGVMNANSKKFWFSGAGGGGGAGGTGGAGGARGTFTYQSPILSGSTQPTAGNNGTSTSGGAGGYAGGFVLNDGAGGGGGALWNPAYRGGSGGGPGQSGSSSSNLSSPFGQASFFTIGGGLAGAAGLAVKGSNYITFWTTGTIYGGTETV